MDVQNNRHSREDQRWGDSDRTKTIIDLFVFPPKELARVVETRPIRLAIQVFMDDAFDNLRISLNVIGDDLDPEEISLLLGAQPTEVYRKGDATLGTNEAFSRYAQSGSWCLDVTSERLEEPDFETSLSMLLELLTDDMTVWQSLSVRFNTDFFCGLFLADSNRDVVLSVPLMSALVERDLHLGLDTYRPDEE